MAMNLSRRKSQQSRRRRNRKLQPLSKCRYTV
jgi:hypothetical protein